MILLPAFGFLLMVAYWPWIAGAGTAPRWLVIVGALLGLAPVLIRHGGRVTSAHIAGFLFVAWALLTLTWSATPYDSLDAAWKLLALALLFMVGAALPDLSPVYIAAAFGIAVSSALVIVQRLGLLTVNVQMEHPSGLFVNGLFLAEAAAMVFIACLALRRWWLAAIVAPSLVLVHLPRGPWLALAVAGLLVLWRHSRRMVAVGTGAIAAGLPVAIWWRPETVRERLDMWGDAIGAISAFGSGLGSYTGRMPFISHRIDVAAALLQHPHNDLIEIAVETGVVGAGLALAFLSTIIFAARNEGANHADLLVVVVFAIMGLFGFPLALPATAGLFALVAGHRSRRLSAWGGRPVAG